MDVRSRGITPQRSSSGAWPQALRATGAVDDPSAPFRGFQAQRSSSDPMELEIQALVQSVDEQLSAIDPFARTNREANGASPDDVRAVQEVPSFLSHHPVYQESLIAKRLQLYERQLAIREQQLAKLQQMNEQANSTIRRLHEDLATQRKAFEDAQTDWEEEKTALLRFRVGAAQDQSQKATLMRNLLGNRPLPMTGRTRDDDAEQRRHQQWRLQMLSGAADAQAQLDDAAPLQLAALSRGGRTWRRLKLLFQRRLAPFATDIRQIEARFGYSVASYFRFFRWIILAFVAVAIPALGLLVMHIVVIVRSRDAQPSSDTTWRQFVGVAPRFLLLSGHYEAEALAYTSVLVAMEILLLVLTFHKWILEDRASKTVEAMDNGEKKPKFAKLILNAWDSSLSTKEAFSDMQRAIEEQLKLAMAEERLSETLRHRTKKEWYLLYARRLLAFLVYLTVQASSWYLIIVLTTQSTEIQAWIALKAKVLSPYASSIVPAAVTVLNAALPTIISLLTQLERWDHSGFAVKAMITRLYLAKVLNVIIQLVSYALLLDPYLLAATTSILDISQDNGTEKAVPLSALSLVERTEFLVPQKMVALLYSCTIALVAVPLAPSVALLALVLHVINFKFDKAILMRLQKKPTSPWSAKDAGEFFIKFFFCTVVIFIAFVHFFLGNRPCGTTSPLVLESYQIEEQASAAAAMMAEAAASPSGGQRGPTRGAAAGRSNSQESAMSDAMMDDEASDSDLWTQAEIEWAHVEAHQESNTMRKRK
ncbi:hypothetical protein ATCC90586_001129 [Pythium insidiosum]|nr:hypothetical protein ATCC90586_001129 [Pythium insidiosum]